VLGLTQYLNESIREAGLRFGFQTASKDAGGSERSARSIVAVPSVSTGSCAFDERCCVAPVLLVAEFAVRRQ